MLSPNINYDPTLKRDSSVGKSKNIGLIIGIPYSLACLNVV